MRVVKETEEKCFREIYATLYTPLCRLANLYLRDIALSEDVVSDVIFELWKRHEEASNIHSLSSYLKKAVRNRCISELNTLAHRTETHFTAFSLQDNAAFLQSLFADDSQPLDALLYSEMEQKLLHDIDMLPQESRSVFMKSRFEQKSYEEIGAELGISVNTVKYHIKKALAHLRQQRQSHTDLFLLFLL